MSEFQTASTVLIRRLAILRAYDLHEQLSNAPNLDARDEILLAKAEETGRDVATLRREAEMAEGLRWVDLQWAFTQATIPEEDWLERLSIDHLLLIGQAKDQRTSRLWTSKQKAGLAVEAFHANMKVDELRQYMVEQNILKAQPGLTTAPTKRLTAGQYLVNLGTWMQRTGTDFEVESIPVFFDQPWPVFKALWMIQQRLSVLYPRAKYPVQRNPQAEWAPKVEEKAAATPQKGESQER